MALLEQDITQVTISNANDFYNRGYFYRIQLIRLPPLGNASSSLIDDDELQLQIWQLFRTLFDSHFHLN